MPAENRRLPDRKLGDEWLGWNGDLEQIEVDVETGKRVFMGFLLLGIALLSLGALVFWYLIKPRLELISSHLSHWVGYLIASGIGFLLVCFIDVLLFITTEKSFLFRFRMVEVFINFLTPLVFRISQRFGISKDRMGNSFIKVSNALIRATQKGIKQSKLLILIPHCLQHSIREKILELAKKYQCIIFTASGGTIARKIVREQSPSAIIGIACERDLITGIQDIISRIPVIGIPNQRPEGPCKNTIVNFKDVEAAVQFFLNKPL
ncbi:MAG: DUF116 domain-containing protein [candidate division KSB1 bacterium]|nr:DUF116 domain-containing protein [candidate division KSB1 bacterium]